MHGQNHIKMIFYATNVTHVCHTRRHTEKKKRIGFKQSVLCNVVLRCLKQIAWKQSLMFPGRVINLVRRLGKFGEFLDTDAGK